MNDLDKIIKECLTCKSFNFPDFPDYWVTIKNEAIRETIYSNYRIFSGYCKDCGEIFRKQYKAEIRHLKFLNKAKEYFKV